MRNQHPPKISKIKGSCVLIIISGHFANAPRPQKEARALREAGARVLVRGAWWSATLAKEDIVLAKEMDVEFSPIVDLRKRDVQNFSIRLRQHIARKIYRSFGYVTPRVFGLGAPEFLREAKRINADITIVHSEVGLWVGKILLKEHRKIGVDFEDWFSQDLLPEDRKERPVAELQALERYMLKHAHFCYTTSKTLAHALALDAGIDRLPKVVPNCFPAAECTHSIQLPRDAKPDGVVSFHWFSQTIGPGRGLELLAQALPLLTGEWQLSLRGNMSGYQAWFDSTFPESVKPRIQILDPVPNAELLARTMSHDVGLALEIPNSKNRDLTVANKLFEYLSAGLAVIATRTKGQQEVMRICPGAGVLIPTDDPLELARIMQKMLDNKNYLASCRCESAKAGKTVWSWEHHAPKLLQAVAEGLDRPQS